MINRPRFNDKTALIEHAGLRPNTEEKKTRRPRNGHLKDSIFRARSATDLAVKTRTFARHLSVGSPWAAAARRYCDASPVVDSPPARVASACHADRSILSLMPCTEASIKLTFTTPA
jgi:hypothetical protein